MNIMIFGNYKSSNSVNFHKFNLSNARIKDVSYNDADLKQIFQKEIIE